MSFDMYLAPATGFLDWTPDQWDQYFTREPLPEWVRLGKSVYIGYMLEAIAHNLENDKLGSRFPLLMKIETADPLGWYSTEIEPLLDEVGQIKAELAALPINRSTLSYDNEEDVAKRIDDFKKAWPERPVENLLDLHFYFFEAFEKLAGRASETRQGLFIAV